MAGPKRDRVFVKHTYTTKLGAGQAHTRYIAFRSRDMPDQDRGAFSRDRDHAQVDSFNRSLDHRLIRHPQVATLHKVVLSLREDQWRATEWTSWKPAVREVMARFETATGKRLNWIAAEHMTRGHPHCHVAIAGVCRDQMGQERRLRITMREIKILQEEFQRIYERDRVLHRSVEQELDREQERIERPVIGRVAGDLLRKLVQAVNRENRRHQLEREMAERQRERERERGG